MAKKKADKKEPKTTWVLVDAVSQFLMQYLVEVPDDSKAEWALDVVTCEEAKEFSQKHLGEVIVSHRIVSKKEALAISDKMNSYSENWEDQKKIEAFFTKIEDYKDGK